MTQTADILLVSPEPGDVELVRGWSKDFRSLQLRFEWAADLRKGQQMMEQSRHDLCLVANEPGSRDGLELVRKLGANGHFVPLLLLLGEQDRHLEAEAISAGALDCLVRDELTSELAERTFRLALVRSPILADSRESEQRYQLAVEGAREGIWDWNLVSGKMFLSPRWKQLLGFKDEEIGNSPDDCFALVHPDDLERVRKEISDHLDGVIPYLEEEHRMLDKEGNIRWMLTRGRAIRDGSGKAVRLTGMISDITAKKATETALTETEQQLRQSQKMEAMGQLAGGVAHDFNNLLTVVSGYADLSLLFLTKGKARISELREHVAGIKDAADRAQDLARQLLTFSRRDSGDPELLDPNRVVSGMNRMLDRLIPANVDLSTSTRCEGSRILCDRNQVEQVITNLVVNARDALPEGGKIVIETSDLEVDEGFVGSHDGMEPGPYVLLAVSDNGTGIDKETQARLFEPFFTTKPKGKGTGLGLSTVYGIVQQAGGSIWVYSELHKGTTFKIYLPAQQAPQEKVLVEPKEPVVAETGKTLMLVEDEPSLRSFMAKSLKQDGYQVLEAGNGREALLVYEKHPGLIDLVVTDVVMPELGAHGMVREMGARGYDVQLLFVSGYTEHAIFKQGLLDPGSNFLAKPFTPSVLRERVADALKAQGCSVNQVLTPRPQSDQAEQQETTASA